MRNRDVRHPVDGADVTHLMNEAHGPGDRVKHLAVLISAHLRAWDPSPASVELAVFDTDNPSRIAAEIDRICVRSLGAGIARGLFYHSASAV